MKKQDVKKGFLLQENESIDYSYEIDDSERYAHTITLFYSKSGEWVEKLKGKPAMKLLDSGNGLILTIYNQVASTKHHIALNYEDLHNIGMLLNLRRGKQTPLFKHLVAKKKLAKKS